MGAATAASAGGTGVASTVRPAVGRGRRPGFREGRRPFVPRWGRPGDRSRPRRQHGRRGWGRGDRLGGQPTGRLDVGQRFGPEVALPVRAAHPASRPRSATVSMPSATTCRPSCWASRTMPLMTVCWRCEAARVSDERFVDLDDVDRGLHQVAQRREAGAEVVDGEPDAGVAQRRQLGPDLVLLAQQHALGQLHHQGRRGRPAAVSSRSTRSAKPGRAELAGRDVDADVRAVGSRSGTSARRPRPRRAGPRRRSPRCARSPRPGR